ncbi:hypothetical protein [Streptomyces sp. NPDC004783]
MAVTHDQDVRTAARNSSCWSRAPAAEAADRWAIHLPNPTNRSAAA